MTETSCNHDIDSFSKCQSTLKFDFPINFCINTRTQLQVYLKWECFSLQDRAVEGVGMCTCSVE